MKRRIIACCLAASMVLGLAGCMEDEGYEGYEDYEGDYSEDEYESYDESEDDGYYSESEMNNSGSEYGYPYDNRLGTAKELEGKIAVVSIYVNDATTGWDFESEADQQMDALIYKNLEVATDYLEDVSKSYGKDVEFIYDWNQYPELVIELDINEIDYQYMEGDFDNIVYSYIDQNVQTAKILNDVGAEQVIYMMYFNTPATNTTTSCTVFCYEAEITYEVCYMFMNCQGDLECPSTFAHEMLHTFGVPDLYSADDYGITQEYVDYAADSGLNDIMRINEDPQTGEYLYDSIANEVTDITAYYAGLTDYSETVNEWGFAPSQH